ncbi:methylmalonyl-CoA mutase [Marmoricola sp. Leaf446]|uniref:methylmalonyl-CoA mutase family protein n=1 Tax=Marmoricola sp. Leaf446 TaxID=1736379 RepID=UPI0006FB15E9|nr:methylmalonyl-CoA mutase family protein [Marmoricola sp. Leaf446]KQT94185.1 methylmalonyl-CoA mutase [Marmoricola sp. Leaf446]
MTSDARLSLAEGSRHTREDWERAAAAVLRKARRLGEDAPDHDVWEALTGTTLDGLRVPPLGTPELVADLPAPVRPPARDAGWDVRAWLADADAARGNAALLTDLENGATSLLVQVGAGGTAPEDLARLLDGVLLDVAAVVLDAPGDPLGAARALAAVAEGVEAPLAAGTNLGVDPVAARVRGLTGDGAVEDDDETLRQAATLARGLGCRAFVVDGTALHDLGASDVQEVGYALAVAVHLLRTLERAGVDVDEAAGLVEFRLAATDQQFVTIAKLRAVRRLWARVLELSGASEDRRQMVLHAMTSRPMMTRYDPWVNQLRTCVAAFAAGVGGADAVTVLPFDSRLGVPDAFGRRIARNTSTLLVEESHVARVADPAGGAFAVEGLTDDLAVAAWEELGRLEGSGGVHAALEDGSLQSRVDDVVAERDRRVATRALPLTGTSEFPHLGETLPEREPYAEGSYLVRPYAEPFEHLRDEPAATPVFLATMGSVAAHTARATFARNLFAAGGVDVVNQGAHDDVEAVLADYRGPDGGQPVVCLVGHDRAYDAWGADLAAALREAGAAHVVVAGKARDWADDSCALGVDALDFLRRTRENLR